ncbi:hypothetical protein, partial [Phormidesmis priestleyi]
MNIVEVTQTDFEEWLNLAVTSSLTKSKIMVIALPRSLLRLPASSGFPGNLPPQAAVPSVQ